MTRHGPPEPMSAAPLYSVFLDSEVAQMTDLLTCSLQAWSAYWTAWLNARGVDDILRANLTLAAEGFDLAGMAAARRQSFHGRVTPTLNEA